MKKLSLGIEGLVSALGGEEDLAKKARRAAQVRAMWAACVDELFLEHTNSVYIVKKDRIKTLIVYVDESIYAAELNARRELIKLKFLQDFQEEIDEFKIIISRGNYKKNYPYLKEEKILGPQKQKRKLSAEEKNQIQEVVSTIEDESLRKAVKEAMTADWQWKKTSP